MTSCKFNNCGRQTKTLGYCSAHYTRMLRGRPMDAPVQVRTAHLPMSERLALLSKPDPSGCILWTGRKDASGYGEIWSGGRHHGAHRASYEEAFGPIPEGMQVCHRCDVRQCINPEHLFLGTNSDNVADKVAKGRSPRGEAIARAILTEDDVREIRRAYAAGASGLKIAKSYPVGHRAIYGVLRGETWRHVK